MFWLRRAFLKYKMQRVELICLCEWSLHSCNNVASLTKMNVSWGWGWFYISYLGGIP